MRRGQGNTEFIVVVALVAIAAIGVVTLFGDNLRSLFGASSDAVAGDADIENRGAKSQPGVTNKTMGNFAQSSAYDPGVWKSSGGSSGSQTAGAGASSK